MPVFYYKAVSAEGDTFEGKMDGAAQEAVVQRLQSTGYIPIRISSIPFGVGEENAAPAGLLQTLRRRRISQSDIATMTRELSTLLQSGMALDRSLEILQQLSESQELRQLLNQIRDDVRNGNALSVAMENRPGVFSRFYLNMIKAGEAGGALGPVLQRITEFMERAAALKDTVVSALIYPTILIVVSIASVMLLLAFVVPQFAPMFAQSGKALPAATQFVISAGEFLRDDWWILLVSGLGTVALARQQMEKTESRRRWDAIFLRIPLVGTLLVRIEMARLSRSLGTLLGNGVPLLNALMIVKETVGNSILAEGIAGVATQLKAGQGMGKPMMESGCFPRLAVHMVMVGEETGQLEAMMLKVADVYDREVQNAVKRLLTLLEPLLILGLGLMVGGIILSILVAILSVNDLAI